MIAEVISIGDELTSGQRLDTNSQWLSERLGELGIRVMFHSTVGDDLAANELVFRQAVARAEIIVTTGGLGPTADDLTRQAIAAATGTELLLDEAVLEHIRQLFARRNRDMPQRNVVQAYFPAGSRVIPNPHGSAPGIDIDVPRGERNASRIFALPGVPAEMREMWALSVEPALLAIDSGPRRVIRHRRLKCFGVGESDLEQMLPDLIQRGRQPSVGITVHRATITLRITAEGESHDGCLAAMQPTIATIHECLGDLVFGEEDDELHHAVGRLLGAANQTLAIAEIGTGGLVSEWLSETSEADRVFRGAIVVRSSDAVGKAGGVPSDVLDRDGWNSSPAVAAMAQNCRSMFETDFALAIGPFPRGDFATSEAGLYWYALADREGVGVKSSPFAGHPDILTSLSAKRALNYLRLTLLRELKAGRK